MSMDLLPGSSPGRSLSIIILVFGGHLCSVLSYLSLKEPTIHFWGSPHNFCKIVWVLTVKDLSQNHMLLLSLFQGPVWKSYVICPYFEGQNAVPYWITFSVY